MACCSSSDSADNSAGKKVSQAIDKELQEWKQEMKKEIKLLLLGAGASGKSTLAKQIRLLYVTPYTDQERLKYRAIIFTNVCFGMREILGHIKLSSWPTKSLKRAAQAIGTMEFVFPESDPLQPEIGPYLERLWESDNVQNIFDQKHELNLTPTLNHFMSRISEISKPSYLPSDQDILYSRQRTRGIIETVYQQDHTRFRLVDVGGQRNERSKWIHCFEGVGAIIFVAAISEYNQFLEEDPSVNRLDESLQLFKGIVSYQWFLDTAVVLFLNKTDLLREKIHRVPLSDYFPKFKWPPNNSSHKSSGNSGVASNSNSNARISAATGADQSGASSKTKVAPSSATSKTGDPDGSTSNSTATTGSWSGGDHETSSPRRKTYKPRDLEKHAMKFIEKLFLKRLPKAKGEKHSSRICYTHFTCATDSQQTKGLFIIFFFFFLSLSLFIFIFPKILIFFFCV